LAGLLNLLLSVYPNRDTSASFFNYFKFLFVESILDRNLTKSLKPIVLTTPSLPTFTEQQLKSILNEPDQQSFNGQRDYAIMLVFLDTGLRVNECKR